MLLAKVWWSEKSTPEIGFLKISQDPSVGFRYPRFKTELKYVSWFLPSLMVQKILWPEIWQRQGRSHATEKLENHENDEEN